MSMRRKSRDNKPPKVARVVKAGRRWVTRAMSIVRRYDYFGALQTERRVYAFELHPTKGWRKHRVR